jgi:hypothetical protein
MKRQSEEEKAMWVEDWKQSESSLHAYAKTNGLNPTTLKNWAREAEEGQDFVEVKSPLPIAMGYIPEILIEKGDIRIHLPVAIRREDLCAVIQSLGWQL